MTRIRHVLASADGAYNGLTGVAELVLTVDDDDEPGVSITAKACSA